MRPIFSLVKYLHCKFISAETNFVAFDPFCGSNFQKISLRGDKGPKLLRNCQLVTNLKVHLFRLLSLARIKTIKKHFFCCDKTIAASLSQLTFAQIYHVTFWQPMALSFTTTKHLCFELLFQRGCFNRENSYHSINIGVFHSTIPCKKNFRKRRKLFSSFS